MAEITKSKYATDIKNIRFGGVTGRAFMDGKEVMRMIYDGEIVFNRALFELICEDEISLAAVGSRELPLYDILDLVSRKTDCDGITIEVEFEGGSEVIEPNETEEEKNGTYTIKQKYSDLEVSGKWTQEAAKIEKYEFMYVDHASVRYDDNIRAGGSTVDPRITVYYMLKEILSSGVNRQKLYSNAGYATEANGAPLNSSGATIDDDGGVYAGSLGKKETNEMEVFAVNEMEGTVYISQTGETKPWNWTGSVFVYQNQNKPNYGDPYYSIWSDVTPDSLDAATTSVQVEISAWLLTDIVWSSGAEDQESERATVFLEPSVGTLSSTSASGNASITWSGLRNTTGLDRTISLRIYHGSTGVYDKTYSLSQSGAEFSRWVYWKIQSVSAGYDQIPAGGGTVTPYVSVTVLYCAEYTDGTNHYDETTTKTFSGVSVSTATAPNAPSISGVIFNTKTGAVYAPGLGQVSAPETDVFYVGSLSGSFVESVSDVTVEWTWNEGAVVEQAENYQRWTGDIGYTFDSEISPEELEGSNTIITVTYDAWKHEYYYWDSAPSTILSDDTKQWMYIRITGDVTASKDVQGSGTYTYDVGKTTSDRTFKVTVTNDFDYKDELSITQTARVFSHYKFVGVYSVGAGYEEAPAWGGSMSPSVSIRAIFHAVYSDGYEDSTAVYDDYGALSVTSAGGSPKNTSGATINTTTGVVSVKNLATTPTASRPVFEVTSMGGKFYAELSDSTESWVLTNSATVEQAENYLQSYSDNDVYNSSTSEEMLSGDSVLYVAYQAQHVKVQKWDSDRYEEYLVTNTTNLSMKIVVSGAYSETRTVSGKNTAAFTVGTNGNTASSRTFTVKTYNANGGLVNTHTVVQAANILSWLAPTISGSWSVSNISAKGGSTTVRVPIVQLQVNTSGTEVDRYEGWADAITIGGTASNGGSVSGGTISAPNLGQTATSERTIFTITSVKVKSGGDGKEYTISVSPSVAVKQNANYQWVERSRSNVSITPQGNIPALGGSATLLVNAYEWVYYYWASAPDTPTNETGFSMTGYVTAASGTITGSPIVGTGKQVTLTYNTENFGAARSITASLRAVSGVGLSDINISQAVTQSAASYVLTAGSDHECNATASTVYVTFVSSRNGKAWQPSFSANLSGVTFGTPSLSGTTYTVAVNIPSNSSSSVRDIVVTATQSRYSGDATATVTITQAGAAGTVIRTVEAYGSWNSAFTKVINISAFLSNSSGSSVTFSGIKVELRRLPKTSGNNPVASNLVATASYSGSVTLAANGSTTISISDITHTMDSSYNYWLAAYATQTTETTYNEIEQDVAEG